MDARETSLDQIVPVSALLGYLNFSDGRSDPRWQKHLNDAYAWLLGQGEARPWLALHTWLSRGLDRLRGSSAAFRDVTQAEEVLAALPNVLVAYQKHHADLLAHLADEQLFLPFFLARVFEAILAQRAREGELGTEEAIAAILTRLNDFVGYRPVALLETRPQGEPYEHERHRPVPLFLRGAGVSCGPSQKIVSQALAILRDTDPNLLAEAQLDLNLLEELAVDVRAYDHGHPVNRRPNYVFGEWDPHHLDNSGRYRRYVVRKITLDGLLDRVLRAAEAQRSGEPAPSGAGESEPAPSGVAVSGGKKPEGRMATSSTQDQLLTEAAAVLAGTILMAVGVTGSGPGAHDSSVSLATLLPRIARYRDAFYEYLLPRLPSEHSARLRQEQTRTRQPFGGARQHLNAFLARHRALQMQQRYLSVLFAAMGYPADSQRESERIPSVSGRLLSAVLSRLTSGQLEVEYGRLAEAAGRLPEIEELLQRGIACGAFADPWNILGFQGLFPLSSAREDSIRDPRLDELVQVIEQTFNLYARLISEAAAMGQSELIGRLLDDLDRLAGWWDQFATSEVSDVRRVQGGEINYAIRNVSEALTRWHQRGETPADLAFWRKHLERFRSPRAFALVIDTLLHKGDYRAALALLTSWIGQAEQVPLEDGNASYHTLALRWMLALTQPNENREIAESVSLTWSQRREIVGKFFDYLEANAEEYWEVPNLDTLEKEEEEDEDLFEAAYEDVTYQDTTDDNEDSSVAEGGPQKEFDLEEQSERLEKRLRFLSTLARLWQVAARFLGSASADEAPVEDTHLHDTLASWLRSAQDRYAQLLGLLDSIHAHPLPAPSGEYDSLVEFDRRRVVKERLLFTTLSACLDVSLAVGALRGALSLPEEVPPASKLSQRTAAARSTEEEKTLEPAWEPIAIQLEQALFRGDAESARSALGPFIEHFQLEPLLFTPLTEGGEPRRILQVRTAQTVLRALLANLPRLGLLRETYTLLRTARSMEQTQPPRGRGVTEFNHFFQAAFQATLESVLSSAESWTTEQKSDQHLVEILERLTAPFLTLWIDHSRTLQLSILETIESDAEWRRLQEFVQNYGQDLFHSRFMTLGNLRGILHRGVSQYLDDLRDNPDPLHPIHLLDDLGGSIRRSDAVRWLEMVLQAIVENYEEYKDYNTTTTQSDYGENLYVLLEMVRLKAAYERHAWQFRPLVLAHEVLARRGRPAAAVLWEQSLAQLTREVAQHYLDQLARLEQAHGVRLNTVSDRLNERFVKPLALDRICALIESAMLAVQRGSDDRSAFDQLRQEIEPFTTTPAGVGLDVPYWLRRMEMEVHRVQAAQTTVALLAEHFFRIPRRPLDYDDLQRQLRDWDRPLLER